MFDVKQLNIGDSKDTNVCSLTFTKETKRTSNKEYGEATTLVEIMCNFRILKHFINLFIAESSENDQNEIT